MGYLVTRATAGHGIAVADSSANGGHNGTATTITFGSANDDRAGFAIKEKETGD